MQRDTRKRPNIHELLQTEIIQKKAKQLGFVVPTKDEVMDQIANQHTEMKTTFMKKAETDASSKGEKPIGSKGKSKSDSSPALPGSDSNKNKKASNLMDYKANAPKSKSTMQTPVEKKSEHELKVIELENKINERKKKNEENLNKNLKIKNQPVPNSYLKDPSMIKALSEGEKIKDKNGALSNNKYVNKSALVVDLPKTTSNQKVLKEGIKHDEVKIQISKPKPPKTSQQDLRPAVDTPTSAGVKNARVRGGQQSTGVSRAAQLAAKKGSNLTNKKGIVDEKKAIKKEIEDVYNLPDFPTKNDSSDEDKPVHGMNKSAMQLVAEHREKQLKKTNSVNVSSSKVAEINNQKMVLPPKADPYKSSKQVMKSENDAFLLPPTSQAKKESYGQQRMDSADFDDLLGVGPSKKSVPKQKQVSDDDFDSLLNTNSKPSKLETDAASLPVELAWKINDTSNDEFKEETDEQTPDDDISDESLEDVDAAFNFTDTEFDANNRDDYTVDTEILNANAQGSLSSIAEVDEESEQTIQKKKCQIEIKSLEKRLQEMEITQKSKWNLCVQIAGEKAAQA